MSPGDEPTQSAGDEAVDSGSIEREVAHLFGRDSLYMALWAVQLLVAALMTPILTRVLGQSEFSMTAAAMAVMQVMFVLAGLALSGGIQRAYSRPDGEVAARRLVTFAVGVAVAVTLLLAVSGNVWAPLMGLKYGSVIQVSVWWAGMAAVTNATLAVLRSQDRLASFAVVSMLQSTVAEATGLLLVLLVDDTAWWAITGKAIAQGLAMVVSLQLTRPLPLRFADRDLVDKLLRFSLPLVPNALAVFVMGASDRFVVLNKLGDNELARYAVAYNIGSISILLLSVLNTAWLPRFFNAERVGSHTLLLSASRDAMYRVLLPLILGHALVMPVMLRLWAPPSYDPGGLVLLTGVVIVSVVPYAAGLSATRSLMIAGRTLPISISAGVAAVANLALNLVLVPHFELLGAAASTFIAYGIQYLMLQRYASRVIEVVPTPAALLWTLWGASALAIVSCLLPTTGRGDSARLIASVGAGIWMLSALGRLSRPSQ